MAKIYRIHPAIGIARVGNADRPQGSDSGWFIGPELPGAPATPAGSGFKDASGRVRAQAARFRVFEFDVDANGKVGPGVEVHLDDGRTTKIEWTVELANRKASFFNFDGQTGAADLHGSRGPADRRNKLIEDGLVTPMALRARSERLDLAPGARTVAGRHAGNVHFTVNRPPLSIDTLGELRTDARGALVVIGGKGKSDKDGGLPWSHKGPDGRPLPVGVIQSYANNDQWFDDVSDGPVKAKITIDGTPHDAEAAWVLVGPPDFAPHLLNYRTMYDTLVDVIVRHLPIPNDARFDGALKYIADMKADWNEATQRFTAFRPSFTRDIAPILETLLGVWRVFDPRLQSTQPDRNFHSRIDLAELGGAGSNAARRRDVFRRLRDPRSVTSPAPGAGPEFNKMPLTYGDFYNVGNHPGRLHTVAEVQYGMLHQWQKGDFIEDWTGSPAAPATSITAEGLDRAALENVVGGAFYPGIEASWMLARPEMFRSPFRIDLGKLVRGATAVGDMVIGAGFFSQQMALPWQADFLACARDRRDDNSVTGRLIAWWPVQRPDDVFPDFAPRARKEWARTADDARLGGYEAMVERWWTLGFVVSKDGDLFETGGPGPAA